MDVVCRSNAVSMPERMNQSGIRCNVLRPSFCAVILLFADAANLPQRKERKTGTAHPARGHGKVEETMSRETIKLIRSLSIHPKQISSIAIARLRCLERWFPSGQPKPAQMGCPNFVAMVTAAHWCVLRSDTPAVDETEARKASPCKANAVLIGYNLWDDLHRDVPMLDHSAAALIDDLRARGLQESSCLVNLAERRVSSSSAETNRAAMTGAR